MGEGKVSDRRKRILVAGELNVDLVLQGYSSFPTPGREVLVDDVELTLGSASAICAAGLAKLGDHVTFAGKLGRDAWGDLCVQRLEQLGVDLSLVIRNSSIKTGITVSISSTRDRALVTYLGSIAELRAEDIDPAVLPAFEHLHVSSFYMQKALRPGVAGLLRAAHEAGLTTSLDPGFDPSEEWGRDLFDVLREVDLFFPNEVELAAITGESDVSHGLTALDNGRTITIAKLGSDGCRTTSLRVPAFRVDPVDTTGAGDSFNAGFLHSWLQYRDVEKAMRFGAACGALSTLGLGGTGSQPTAAETEAFLAPQEVR
jgi:sugar/nucleoside kinase (ribokinase family)